MDLYAILALYQQIEKKIDPKASKCVFVGFKRGTKGYVLLNIQSREIFVSRDVVFYEHIFPYQKVEDTSNKTNSLSIFYQNPFNKDQLVLNQPSQPLLYPLHLVIIM